MNEAALVRSEAIVEASGVAPRLEALLPVGVRPRQLGVHALWSASASPSQTAARPISRVCTAR